MQEKTSFTSLSIQMQNSFSPLLTNSLQERHYETSIIENYINHTDEYGC